MASCDESFDDGPHDGPHDWDTDNYTDDFGLRFRNPYAHGLSYDDEILFLISKVSSVRNIPFGYISTGCVVIPRKRRDIFRITMLNNFKSHDYVKAPLSKFMALGNLSNPIKCLSLN